MAYYSKAEYRTYPATQDDLSHGRFAKYPRPGDLVQLKDAGTYPSGDTFEYCNDLVGLVTSIGWRPLTQWEHHLLEDKQLDSRDVKKAWFCNVLWASRPPPWIGRGAGVADDVRASWLKVVEREKDI